MTADLSIQLLGDVRLAYGGELVTTVNTARMQALLAYLVLHRDAPQSRQHLAFLFWPDSTERQARTNLRNLLHLLRRALPAADDFLQVGTQTIGWLPDAPVTSDVADFEEALAEALRARNPTARRRALERAVALYQGELLPSCYDDWILPERERLRQAFTGALERLVELLEEARDYGAAIRQAQSLLRHDPLHEAAYRRLMRLHALAGDRAGALRVYHTCATVLVRELGVGPGPATREAYERLMSVGAPGTPPARAVSGRTSLVGREHDWTELQAAWRKTAHGKPHLALLSGEAGIGKTRLAEELLSWAARQGIPTASARCYASSARLAFAPVTAWLRSESLRENLPALEPVWLTEIARLLPELLVDVPELPPPGPLSEVWQRQRLFEALARPVCQERQLVLSLDDVQWCDHETLEWLAYLLQSETAGRHAVDRRARLMVVVGLRVEEMPGDEAFMALLQDLRRGDQLTEVALGRLNQQQVEALAADLGDGELETALAQKLYRETEGNPLFIVEMVRAGLVASGGVNGAAPGRWRLPPSVHQAIRDRLMRLSPQAQGLAELAATIGREFSFDVLVLANNGDEEGLVQGLDELWQRRIVREQGAEAYDFSHDKIREVAYAGLSAARRRMLHRRVADALETLHAEDLDPVSDQIGAHYQRAGQPGLALPHYRRAAEAAQRVYANQEAVAHYRQALAVLDGLPAGDITPEASQQLAAGLYEGLGGVLALTGQHKEARNAYFEGLNHILGRNSIQRARIQRRIGDTWSSQQMFDAAEEAYEQALRSLGPDPLPTDSTRWQTWLDIQMERVNVLYYQSRLGELDELCKLIQQPVTDFGTAMQKANFYSALVMLRLRQERFVPSETTLLHGEASLRWALQTTNPILINHKTFGIGFCLLWSGDAEGAIAQMKSALFTAEQMGHEQVTTQCLAYLGVAHRLKGATAQAEIYTERGLKAATALQNRLYIAVAEANLSWLAYCGRDFDAAAGLGKTASSHWQGIAFPFQWLALWPLIGVALAQDELADAMDCVRELLDPSQQRMPDTLAVTLETALEECERGDLDDARASLKHAAKAAARQGYL